MTEFKDMLKYFREQAGLSQAELAKIIGVAASTISMYEIGKRTPPFEIEEKLADYFNVSLDILRGRDEEEPLSESEKMLLKKYSKLSDKQKETVLAVINTLIG